MNTPDDEASKFWIGGAGQHGKICTVFAQLTVNGKWEGPHVFVVRLRDDAGNLAPGAPLCIRCRAPPCVFVAGLALAVHAIMHDNTQMYRYLQNHFLSAQLTGPMGS